MKALLIISHGSRRKASNEEVRELTQKVAAVATGSFDLVTCAFLEIEPPNPTKTITELVNAGIKEITILPHFLAAGTHVANDIPRIIEAVQRHHPNIDINILPHLGGLNGIEKLILSAVFSSQN